MATDISEGQALIDARAECRAAEAALQRAVAALRAGGLPENAAELERVPGGLNVWTKPGGWLDILASQVPDPLE